MRQWKSITESAWGLCALVPVTPPSVRTNGKGRLVEWDQGAGRGSRRYEGFGGLRENHHPELRIPQKGSRTCVVGRVRRAGGERQGRPGALRPLNGSKSISSGGERQDRARRPAARVPGAAAVPTISYSPEREVTSSSAPPRWPSHADPGMGTCPTHRTPRHSSGR